MSTPLLQTKLYVPPTRPEWVLRPGLVERLNAGLSRVLTLVSAPAGFGKTALLSEWAATAGSPVALGWVSLDSGDNDPQRFWAYVLAALQAGRGAPAALPHSRDASAPATIEGVLAALLNEAAAGEAVPVLVLDDYHLITEPAIHNALAYLLERTAPQVGPGGGGLRLVIATRADPPLPLVRLRARGQLVELRQADLRFDSAEAAALLNQAMGLDLAPEDAEALERRTEGWVVGLQMAGLSLRGHPDPHTFVTAFAGDDRYVADYLAEEVLRRQPPQVRAFLLQTSILERLSGRLCDAVIDAGGEAAAPDPHTHTAGGQAILEQLERSNLFLVPLDSRREWYRYHQLFADLLRRRLGASPEHNQATLHRRASAWYERHGLVTEAVGHARAAGDVERVARLVADNALSMIFHGELATVAGWLGALPETVVRAQPWLGVAHGWALAYAGRLEAVEPVLQAAGRAEEAAQTPGTARRIAGHVAAIRAYVADLRGALPEAVAFGQTALERLDDEDAVGRGFVWSVLATIYRDSGDLRAAARAAREAIDASQAAGATQVTLTALGELAINQIWRGELHAAAATCRRALEAAEAFAGRSGQRLPVAALAYARLSTVLHEWNRRDEALRYARLAVDLGELWGQADVSIIAYAALAAVLAAQGDAEGALRAAERSAQVAHELSPWYGRFIAGRNAGLRLSLGEAGTAIRWAQESGLGIDDEFGLDTEGVYRTLARALLAQGRLDEALHLLHRLRQAADAAGAANQAVEIRTLQAVTLQARGQTGEAGAVLEEALALAEPEGYVRTFLRAGEPMAGLLRQAAARGVAPHYTRALLAAFGQEPQARDEPAVVEQPLVDPLTARELEVLRLVATGASNPQIASTLVITLNTVKKHITHIFGKLGATHRTQAVARARDLGILE